jgi:hypothetical protein
VWQRRSFHECAHELAGVSEDFRAAHTNRWGWAESRRNEVLRNSSVRGVEVLRILALSIRGDQDHGLTERGSRPVGAWRRDATGISVPTFIAEYRPPYSAVTAFTPLRLRDALNKIAHADPRRAGFFANETVHDLLLSGSDRATPWLAVVSLPELCDVITSLPDAATRS